MPRRWLHSRQTLCLRIKSQVLTEFLPDPPSADPTPGQPSVAFLPSRLQHHFLGKARPPPTVSQDPWFCVLSLFGHFHGCNEDAEVMRERMGVSPSVPYAVEGKSQVTLHSLTLVQCPVRAAAQEILVQRMNR